MSLALASRLARRELRGGVRGFRVFLACLALGVAAIAAVGSVREGIRAGLAGEGATLLGGDAAVGLTYRFADAQEHAWIAARADAVSQIATFRSMAVAVAGAGDTAQRALTEVKAVDAAWPLLGAPLLEPAMPLAQALAGEAGRPGIVMDPLLIARLGLTPGDTVRLGEAEFTLTAALVREPDNATGGFGLGPRSLVARDSLAGSGLLAPGSLFDTSIRMTLPAGSDLEALRTATLAEIDGARWRDSRDGAPGVRVFVERLGAFLVLVGIAGLAVGGVGVGAAVGAFLEEKTETIGILKTLGASSRLIMQTYMLQIGALSVLGIAIGLVLGAGLPMLAAPLIEAALPVPADFSLHLAPLAEAALYGALAAALFSLWPLARSEEVRAAVLFRAAATGGGGARLPRWPYLVATLLLLAALIGAATWLTGSARLTLGAGAVLLFAFLALVAAGWAVRRAAAWLSRAGLLRGRPTLRMALGAVARPGGEAGSVVLSLGLGLTVLAAIGQIDNNMRGAIQRELPDVAPSFFVIDIRPDQVDALRARLDGDQGVSRVDAAPMLRGVITRINGQPAREVSDHWVVRGDRGLTYSQTVPERTRVTQGDWWPAGYDGPPLISFAEEEAREIGLNIGDTLTLNILGRDLTGTIASLRAVDFSRAGMGFVLAMNPAALAGAPHSWIATIYADLAAEPAILRDLSDAYPNITVISVRGVIAQVTALMASIAAAITTGAMITLTTGFVVLIGAAAAGERARSYEAALLKTLGATRATVLLNFALRAVILGAAAGLVAVGAGAAAGWAVTHFVMEQSFLFEPVSALLIVSGGVAVTLIAGLAFAWRPLSARPARVLRARE